MTKIEKSLAFALFLVCGQAQAHHSYAPYARDQLSEYRGTITAVKWNNPHILLSLTSSEGNMEVEWITLDGAARTGITKAMFNIGTELIVVGSRNRNPQLRMMSLVKQLAMPAKAWHWITPEQPRLVPAPGTSP